MPTADEPVVVEVAVTLSSVWRWNAVRFEVASSAIVARPLLRPRGGMYEEALRIPSRTDHLPTEDSRTLSDVEMPFIEVVTVSVYSRGHRFLR